jgi:DnaK suppressor protein
MNGLTPAQVEELRTELERDLAKLRRTMASTADAARPVELDQTAVGRLSRMDALQNQHLTQELHDRERGREVSLTNALRRIADGTYGRCVACGGAVAYGRLLVMPEARTCAACGRG